MKKKLNKLMNQWSSNFDSQYTFTGTFKQARLVVDTIRNYDQITLERANINVVQFMERLSRDVLGRSQVRKGNKLEYMGALEGSISASMNGRKRLHVHLAISGVPEFMHPINFEKMAIRRWQKSHWGYEKAYVTELENDPDKYRWASYSFKDIQLNGTDYLITNVPYSR